MIQPVFHIEPYLERIARHHERFIEVLERGTLRVEVYAPLERDPQHPHDQDEVYVVQSGRGWFVNGEDSHEFGPGDVIFVPAGREHRFHDFSEDFATWVLFWGESGGERGTLDPARRLAWGLNESHAKIPLDAPVRSIALFRHGTFSLKLYVPHGYDPQMPGAQDEVYVVQRGRGNFFCSGRQHRFGVGDLLFLPYGMEHHFENFSVETALWIVSYGPQGGELESPAA